MGKIINKFCRDLHTYGNYTFPVPEHVPTRDCNYIWKTKNKTVIGYRLKNLSLPSCLDGVQFVVRCDGGDKLDELMFIFRDNLLWLAILLFLLRLTIVCFLLIQFRPNPDVESTDLKNSDGTINGEPHQLTNPVPNCDDVKMNHMNGGKNFRMVTISTESKGGHQSLNNNRSPV